MSRERITVPYTNGINNEIKGYVDLTDIIDEAVREAELDMEKEDSERKTKDMQTQQTDENARAAEV